MVFQIINTTGYNVCIYVMIIISFLCLFHLFLMFKKGKNKREKRKGNISDVYKVILNNHKKKVIRTERIFRNIFWVLIICILIMSLMKYKYQTIEHFYDMNVYESDDSPPFFKKEERSYINQQDWARKKLHFDWYDERFQNEEDNITWEDVEYYKENVQNLYNEMPYKVDSYINYKELGIEAQKKYNELFLGFSEIVHVPIAQKSSDDLWDAYEDGKELYKINSTSEVIFQAGVLAEGAHTNAKENDDKTKIYLAGSTDCFEEFLNFIVRDAGDDLLVTEKEIAFRIGKMYYREGMKAYTDENLEARHYILESYGQFNYALENTNIYDEMYPTYLYYSSLSCIRLFPYMDRALQTELCSIELKKWDTLLDNQNIDDLDVENKETKELENIIANLKAYCN